MPTTLEEPARQTNAASAQRMRTIMAAVRVMISWFGVRKTFSRDQKETAADAFGAEGEYVSAAKKLIDTAHPAYKAVTAVRGRVVSYWRGLTLPYPDPGIRLIRQADIASFTVHMTTLKAELADAVDQLNERYGDLKAAARRRLGRLYNPADYPETLSNLFSIDWEHPNVEPPDYLRQLSPQLYEQEAARVAARFDEAVTMAEQAFTEELSRIISHLTERLSGQEDGKPKVFRDSAIENLGDFFERFRHLNVRSNHQLDDLVNQAQRIVRGVEPNALRENTTLRQQVSTQLSGVQSVLDGLLVDRPRRNIQRRPK
jgi:hypothetical protein